DLVDLGRSDARSELLLQLPRLMQQPSELVQRAVGLLPYLDALVDDIAHLVELLVALGQVLDLLCSNRRGEARLTAVEQHHAIVERLHALVADDDRRQLEPAALFADDEP